MDIEKMKNILVSCQQPAFRLRQVMEAVFGERIENWNEAKVLPQKLRDVLQSQFPILSFEIEKINKAQSGRSVKASLKLKDGLLIESVLMSPKFGMWSVCVSSQAGCSLRCAFCATGQEGFRRNLTAEEITDQVLFWKQYLKKNSVADFKFARDLVSNVVYMGMGEPFLNWEEVKKSLEILKDKNTFAFGSRSLSVSTAGIPEGILGLAENFPQVNLALSLHFSENEKRSRYMPINKKHDLEEIKKTLQIYLKKTRRKIFVEYVLLGGINDSRKDVQKLTDFLRSIGDTYLLHVNLIPYNVTGGEFFPTERMKMQMFKNALLRNEIHATLRKSLGEDIQAACGQLISERKKYEKK